MNSLLPEPSETSIGDIFRQAIEAEGKACHLYLSFADMFSSRPELSEFWKALAQDETRHAQELIAVQKSLSEEQLSARADLELWQSMQEIQRLIQSVSLSDIHTLEDAYSLAHTLEYSEVNSVFMFLTKTLIPPALRKQFVLSNIREHQNKLEQFEIAFGDKSWRQRISREPALNRY